MRRAVARTLVFAFLIVCFHSAEAQRNRTELKSRKQIDNRNLDRKKKAETFDKEERFSFYTKAGLIKSQVDGDNMTGYDKTGFEIAGGVNYRLSRMMYINLGIQYNKTGSTKSDPFQDLIPGVFQLGTDINSFGTQFGLMFRPEESRFFVSNSMVFSRLTSFSGENYSFAGIVPTPLELEQSMSNSYWSNETVFGIQLLGNLGLYASASVSFTNLLESSYFDLKIIRPYHIALGAYYRIIP